jgi:hypothetical protein
MYEKCEHAFQKVEMQKPLLNAKICLSHIFLNLILTFWGRHFATRAILHFWPFLFSFSG